jgi:tetratricopeptide (TPR) repeat protein
MRKLSILIAVAGCCVLLFAGCDIIEGLMSLAQIPDPEAEKWLQAGIDYYNKGNLEKAGESFDIAIEKDRKCTDAWRWKGTVYASYDYKKREAIIYYGHAIRLDPRDVQSYYQRGICYYDSEQYLKAFEDFNKAIELSPDYSDAYLRRGWTKIKLERYEDSIKDFSRALEIRPDFVGVYIARGVAYEKLKKYDEAIADYTKAIELDPHDTRTFLSRGIVYTLHGDYENALADVNKAISIDPDRMDSYFARGSIYVQLGKRLEAEKDYRKACEMGYEEACEDLKRITGVGEY